MSEKDQILVVDDASTNIRILSSILTPKYDILPAASGEEALQLLQSDERIDLILLDVVMPGIDGYEVLERVRNMDNRKSVPVILVTALDSIDSEERGLKLGATDYIRKPVNPLLVQLRVSNYLEFVHQRKLLEQLSEFDTLTGLNNRRLFDRMCAREYRRSLRTQSPLTLAVIDIDFFKQVNDNYGHMHGDDVLRRVAGEIREALGRPGDIVARYGGEEFTILMPHTDAEGAGTVLEWVRTRVEALAVPHAHSGCSDVVTISIGHATCDASCPSTAALMNAADEALYAAKNQGRNRVVAAGRAAGDQTPASRSS